MAQCIARAEHGRIELLIRKGEKGYDKFVDVLNTIKENGCVSWYGDVQDEKGIEQSGLVITKKRG